MIYNRQPAKFIYTLILPILILTITFIGCSTTQKAVKQPKRGLLNDKYPAKDELRKMLDTYEEEFNDLIKGAAYEIDSESDSPRINRITLLWRTRLITANSNLINQEEPLAALVDAWSLAVRQNIYLKDGKGSTIFAEFQPKAIATADLIEKTIVNIALNAMPPSVFEETQKSIITFAKENNIEGTFNKVLLYPTQEILSKDKSTFMTALELPLTPFRALEGVDRGAEGIQKLSVTADRFSDIVDQLPESTRWQLLLLLHDLEETNVAQNLLTNLNEFTKNSKSIAQTAENLPQELRNELTLMINELDEKHEKLNSTISEIKNTMALTNTAITNFDNTCNSLTTTSNAIKETTDSWKAASESTNQMLNTFSELKTSPSSKDTKPFNINDYRDTANAINQASQNLTQLTRQLDNLSANSTKIINTITTRAIILIASILIMLLAYHKIKTKIK